jgi:predicted nucleotidyltransferase
MRLSPHQHEIIRETLQRHFGSASRIRLFGSRVDDGAKGGDIDLYIEPAIQEPNEIVEARVNALAELHLVLGDQTIDLIIHREQGPDLPIHRHARETGVLL